MTRIQRWLAHYRRSSLFRHLTWVLCLKLLLLFILWKVWIHPYKQHPDTAMVRDHLLGQVPQVSTNPPPSAYGEQP